MRHKARAKTCQLSTITALFYARQTEQLIINVPPTYVCIRISRPPPLPPSLPLPPPFSLSLACLIRRKTVNGVKFTRTVEQTLKRKHGFGYFMLRVLLVHRLEGSKYMCLLWPPNVATQSFLYFSYCVHKQINP